MKITTRNIKISRATFPALCLLLVTTTLMQPLRASALSGSDFNAGHIIDNVVFTNANAMSVQEIQNFLNAKVGSCDNNGSQPAAPFNSSMTQAQYDASIGKNTQFTCINEYYENTTTLANNLDGNPIPSGAISAAQIIYNAAQEYQINPEVILTTLQKEQGLVTDTWPWDSEYTEAMGYGCPDSQSTCDSQYYGFYNQVNDAAWQFQQYLENPNSYNYVVGSNYILYSPASGCGGSNVTIQNQATAALYDYTPYQPDAAALSNVTSSSDGGTGDSCSSYGNRNFWWYFNEWFGSSLAPDYDAAYYSQSAYPTVVQGQSTDVTLEYQNLGNMPWYDTTNAAANGQDPVTLATYNPINRASDFYSSSWASASRPATTFSAVYDPDGVTLAPDQHTVQPGEIASYTFQVSVPREEPPGTYDEYFVPILEGSPNWYMGAGTVHMNITVVRATQATYVAESAYPTISQNSTAPAYFEFKNTGTATWYDSTDAASNDDYPVVLATNGPVNRASPFSATWPSVSRPDTTFSAVYDSDGVTLAPNQHAVTPGEIAKFSFTMTAGIKLAPEAYQEWFELIREGAPDWQIDNTGVYLNVTVQPSQLQAAYSSESSPLTLQPGQSGTMSFSFRNVGDEPWYDDTSQTASILPVHLATSWPVNRASLFSASWPSVSRPATTFTAVYDSDGVTLASNQHVVEPGEIGQFSFTMTAGSNLAPGTYKEYFEPIVEGAPNQLWNMGGTVWLPVTVN